MDGPRLHSGATTFTKNGIYSVTGADNLTMLTERPIQNIQTTAQTGSLFARCVQKSENVSVLWPVDDVGDIIGPAGRGIKRAAAEPGCGLGKHLS